MRLGPVALSCTIALLAACTKADQEPAADTTATSVGPAPAAAPSLATRYTMVMTPDTTGWTFTFANRPGETIPVRVVAVDGDSVVTDAGPFESSRRKGIQTTTRTVLRMQGDRLVGSTLARYAMRDEDQTLVLRVEATRAQ
jgi:hypothetical protein